MFNNLPYFDVNLLSFKHFCMWFFLVTVCVRKEAYVVKGFGSKKKNFSVWKYNSADWLKHQVFIFDWIYIYAISILCWNFILTFSFSCLDIYKQYFHFLNGPTNWAGWEQFMKKIKLTLISLHTRDFFFSADRLKFGANRHVFSWWCRVFFMDLGVMFFIFHMAPLCFVYGGVMYFSCRCQVLHMAVLSLSFRYVPVS